MCNDLCAITAQWRFPSRKSIAVLRLLRQANTALYTCSNQDGACSWHQQAPPRGGRGCGHGTMGRYCVFARPGKSSRSHSGAPHVFFITTTIPVRPCGCEVQSIYQWLDCIKEDISTVCIVGEAYMIEPIGRPGVCECLEARGKSVC